MLTDKQKGLLADRIALAEMELAALAMLVSHGDELDARAKVDDVVSELNDVKRGIDRFMFDNEDQPAPIVCVNSCPGCECAK